MEQTIESADGNLGLLVQLAAGHFTYSILLHGKPVIVNSSLGQVRNDGDFSETLQSAHCVVQPDLNGSYVLLQGKQQNIDYRYRSWQCELTNDANHSIFVEFALSDTVVAFRYHFPADGFNHTREIQHEATTFHIVKSVGDLQLAQPYDTQKSQYQTFYQPRGDRQAVEIGATEWIDGFGLPALFRMNSNDELTWIMIKEAAFDGSAPASHIADISDDGVASLAFPSDENGNNAFGSGHPQVSLPWTSPWRIITLGTSPQAIVADTSVTDLSTASAIIDSSWITPGSSSWSWYTEPTNPSNYTATKKYIDLAGALGWPYSLLDATWDQQVDEEGRRVSLTEISDYARARDVRLWLWMNSAGPNNDAYEVTPRDLLFDPAVRRKTMQRLSELGIAGLKVDGIESEKQGMMRYLLDILADAADFRLMIVFHNCPVPHGWERTWPNLLSSEGLVTSEYYTNSKVAYAPQMPENNVNEAFTRLTIGPADYAPGTFSHDVYPFDAPMTTYAHEIALHVIIDSGFRCFPEAPAMYQRNLDHEISRFLSDIPFVWDSTHYLTGEPSKYFVVAKRRGNKLYVAGINGETESIAKSRTDRSAVGIPREVMLAVADLPLHGSILTTFADSAASRLPQINAGVKMNASHLSVTMEPFGGFAVVLGGSESAFEPVISAPIAMSVDWSWIHMFLISLPLCSLVVIYFRLRVQR